ncbi:MAG TPA: LysR family transcriptional regulator [Feifaniaceae bacterium]|nr:LysR family transcriptional regulator [Feifaniaceae bacterium]
MSNSKPLRPIITIRLYTEEKCFGPGVAELLFRVREFKSLRSAAMSMNMAYSKAWKIIKASEEALGFKLLDSTTGGQHGGGAVLTEEGNALLDNYREYLADVKTAAQKLFDERFGK